MNYLEEYYKNYNEDGRLLSRHGQVEYLTTMHYIRESLEGLAAPEILEIGAGTGRYSVTLAKEGYHVTSVELIEHNLDILRSKLDGTETLRFFPGALFPRPLRGGAGHEAWRQAPGGLLHERAHCDHVCFRPQQAARGHGPEHAH